MIETFVREAPTASLLEPTPATADAAHPAVPNEPVLNIRNIQGNIIGGFNKDYQTLIFLNIVNPAQFKHWLADFIPFVATADEVLTFNRLYKALRVRRGEPRLEATWINIAFSYHAMRLLTADAAAFTDEAFKQGMAERATLLGDPTDPQAEGHPANWVIGGLYNEADVVITVAADDRDDLAEQVAEIEESIYAGQNGRSGVQVVYKQQGATLPQPLTGHEHFGFLDGVSQPGLRGRLSDLPNDVLTLRQNPDPDERADQGKPGQDLLWPGEFVFGYPGQDANAKDIADKGPVVNAGPAWAADGSFLVFRRLRQDVHGFHTFLHKTGGDLGLDPAEVGAKLVGRWASGAPILRAPLADVPAMGDDDCANNNFEFGKASAPLTASEVKTAEDCTDVIPNSNPPALFPPSQGDLTGAVCPFAGHIRKAYPRDDTSAAIPQLGEVTTQTHRLLRRGIPFGEPNLGSPARPVADNGERGLLFLAYQTSITDQFEFVTRNWVNNRNFKEAGAGFDPILGQNNTSGENRERTFTITIGTGSITLRTQADWVIPTGGGYFFAPSISTLQMLAQ